MKTRLFALLDHGFRHGLLSGLRDLLDSHVIAHAGGRIKIGIVKTDIPQSFHYAGRHGILRGQFQADVEAVGEAALHKLGCGLRVRAGRCRRRGQQRPECPCRTAKEGPPGNHG